MKYKVKWCFAYTIGICSFWFGKASQRKIFLKEILKLCCNVIENNLTKIYENYLASTFYLHKINSNCKRDLMKTLN